MLYILVFFVLAVLSFFEVFSRPKSIASRRLLISFICFVFLVLSTIRWERGTDWLSYYDYFSTIHIIPFLDNQRFEIGYKIVNYLVGYVTSDYTVLLFFLALTVFVFQKNAVIKLAEQSLVAKTNGKEENRYVYPLTMLLIIWSLYLGNVFIVRTTISFIILFYSVYHIHKKNLIKFIFLVVLATLFHRSSVVFLLAYCIYHLRLNKKNFFLSIALAPFIVYFFDTIMLVMAGMLGGLYEYKVTNYLNISGAGSSITGIANNIMLILLFSFLYFKKGFRNNAQFNGMFNLFYFGSIIYIGTYLSSPSLTRIALPFMMSQVVLLTYIFDWIQRKEIRVIVFSILIFYLLLRNYSVISSYWDLFIPFKTIFNKGLDVIIY